MEPTPGLESVSTLQVAFASHDHQHVDAHFGDTQGFELYQIGAQGSRQLPPIQLDGQVQGTEDKIASRIEALSQCQLVYVGNIGGPAAAKLVARHIFPLRSKDNASISSLVSQLQKVLQKESPPPWLQKALLKT